MSNMNGRKSQYKHGTHRAMVQPQHEYELDQSVRDPCWHCAKVHARHEYTHGTSTKKKKKKKTGKRQITYTRAMVQPQHGTSTKRVKRTLPVLIVNARCEYHTRAIKETVPYKPLAATIQETVFVCL